VRLRLTTVRAAVAVAFVVPPEIVTVGTDV
jgi:hypothetical protein